MDRLTVQTRKLQPAMIVLLGILFVPLGLASLGMGLTGGGIAPAGIGVMMLALFGGIVWLGRRAHGRSVRYFSPEGLERNDGRWLPWTELERVIDQIRLDPATREKALWRTEIHFRSGESAWLVPLRVANRGEVEGFVRSLPCEHREVDV